MHLIRHMWNATSKSKYRTSFESLQIDLNLAFHMHRIDLFNSVLNWNSTSKPGLSQIFYVCTRQLISAYDKKFQYNLAFTCIFFCFFFQLFGANLRWRSKTEQIVLFRLCIFLLGGRGEALRWKTDAGRGIFPPFLHKKGSHFLLKKSRVPVFRSHPDYHQKLIKYPTSRQTWLWSHEAITTNGFPFSCHFEL